MNETGEQITRDTLKAIRDSLPNDPRNQAVYDMITGLLSKRTIQAVPYTYSANFAIAGAANFLPAAMAAPVEQLVQIQADSDFMILNQSYQSNQGNSAQTFGTASSARPNVSVMLTDTGSGFQMMDNFIPVPAIFGNGQFPYILPNPKVLPAKGTLKVQALNYDAANAINVRLAFNGVKLYRYN